MVKHSLFIEKGGKTQLLFFIKRVIVATWCLRVKEAKFKLAILTEVLDLFTHWKNEYHVVIGNTTFSYYIPSLKSPLVFSEKVH